MDKKQIPLGSIALPFLAVFACGLICYYAAFILVPLTVALASAYILFPAVRLLGRLHLPRFVAVMVIMAVLVIAGGAVIALIVSQLAKLGEKLPGYFDSAHHLAQGIQTWVDTHLPSTWGISVDLRVPPLDEAKIAHLSSVIFRGLGSASSLLLSALLLFFLTYFLLLDYESYGRKISALFRTADPQRQQEIMRKIDTQLRGFLMAKLIITLVLAIVFSVALLLMGIPYSFIWGTAAALLNLIPYIGPIIGAVPPIIVAGITKGNLSAMIAPALLFFTVQILESYVITPRLTTNMVDLNPLAVIVSTILWGYIWGAIGIILAVPITAAAKVICDNVRSLEPIGILLGKAGTAETSTG